LLIRELVLTYRARPLLPRLDDKRQLLTPSESAQVFSALLSQESVEVFGLLCLTTTLHLIGYYEVGRGTLNSVMVEPRDVFKAALLANAASVIVGHNHPSGVPEPSPEDRHLTRRLSASGQLLGVELVDHIVVGDAGNYLSFKEVGLL